LLIAAVSISAPGILFAYMGSSAITKAQNLMSHGEKLNELAYLLDGGSFLEIGLHVYFIRPGTRER